MAIETLLRVQILSSLKKQGFLVSGDKLFTLNNKNSIRNAQTQARKEKLTKHINFPSNQNGVIKHLS